ncbi:hypothetical protein Droror1_Dr00018385 [Drosera rotundifolia]
MQQAKKNPKRSRRHVKDPHRRFFTIQQSCVKQPVTVRIQISAASQCENLSHSTHKKTIHREVIKGELREAENDQPKSEGVPRREKFTINPIRGLPTRKTKKHHSP